MDKPSAQGARSLSIAVVGAGPVGLALALQCQRHVPGASVTLFDARAAAADISLDPRTLALSLGSIHLLSRLGAWRPESAQPIVEVDISQQEPSLSGLLQPFADQHVQIRAAEAAVPMLGAVVAYGGIVAPLQAAWFEVAAREPVRLHTRFASPVAAVKNLPGGGVEVDCGIAEGFDLAVIAEGGVFAGQARKALVHDYHQTAWVGTVGLAPDTPAGVAYERFTRHGPAALLPLRDRRAALVWCVDSQDDPIASLDDQQRLQVLNTIFPRRVGPLHSLSPLKRFPLGLNAERSLTSGRIVRIGNAAQTLHPVAGQGLNLGLRDAWELVRALRRHPDVTTALARLEWQRAPDRWATIAATDFLARGFTWRFPGAGTARGLGLAAVQAIGPLKSALARQMMFGSR